MKVIPNGYFITFEGIEGTGKTTQVKMLTDFLSNADYAVRSIREPGGTELGEEIRQLVKHRYEGEPPTAVAELLLMGASRAQLMNNIILKELKQGKIVICDRFADSTTVYQGYGRALNRQFIEAMHTATIGSRWPDKTILLDMEAETGLKRADARGTKSDVFERQSLDFHRTIRRGFLDLAKQFPQRMSIVRADQSPEQIHREILKIVNHALTQY